MQVVHPICCGIDVHQAQLTACLRRVTEDGQVTQEVREFATTYPALLALLDWLSAHHCPVAAMGSTGVYWRPVYHVLAGTVEVLVGNAHEMRRRPGRNGVSVNCLYGFERFILQSDQKYYSTQPTVQGNHNAACYAWGGPCDQAPL
jgi:hypothetical protein